MTFSYDASTLASDNNDLVRFRIGDKHSDGYYLENEEIQYWIDNTDSIGEACIKCINYIITQLSQPDFKLDWLTVSNKEAIASWERVRKRIADEDGVSIGATASASVVNPTRADSYQADDTYDGAP